MPISGKGTAMRRMLGAEDVPEEPGVYALAQYNIVTFIGAAQNLREQLVAHAKGDDCTATSTWVKYEVTTADRMEAYAGELLEEFRAEYGSLPRCNDLTSWTPAGPSGASNEAG